MLPKVHEFVAHSTSVRCLALGPKSNQVLATGGDDCKVNVWLVGNAMNIWTLGLNKSPIDCLCFDSEEKNVVSGAMNGSIKVFDLNEGRLARNLGGHRVNVSSIQYHPYGEFIVSGSMDCSMKVWDVRNKTCIQTYSGHDKEITCVRFSPDGRWVASSAKDGQLLIWDLVAGKLLQTLRLQPAYVTSFEFNPSEFLLAAATTARTVRLWDLESMEAISTTPPDSSLIRAMSFCVGQPNICTATKDSLKIWSWESAIEGAAVAAAAAADTADTRTTLPTMRLKGAVDAGWDKMAEIRVSSTNQLIGGSFSSNFVSIFALNLEDSLRDGGLGGGVADAITVVSEAKESTFPSASATAAASASGQEKSAAAGDKRRAPPPYSSSLSTSVSPPTNARVSAPAQAKDADASASASASASRISRVAESKSIGSSPIRTNSIPSSSSSSSSSAAAAAGAAAAGAGAGYNNNNNRRFDYPTSSKSASSPPSTPDDIEKRKNKSYDSQKKALDEYEDDDFDDGGGGRVKHNIVNSNRIHGNEQDQDEDGDGEEDFNSRLAAAGRASAVASISPAMQWESELAARDMATSMGESFWQRQAKLQQKGAGVSTGAGADEETTRAHAMGGEGAGGGGGGGRLESGKGVSNQHQQQSHSLDALLPPASASRFISSKQIADKLVYDAAANKGGNNSNVSSSSQVVSDIGRMQGVDESVIGNVAANGDVVSSNAHDPSRVSGRPRRFPVSDSSPTSHVAPVRAPPVAQPTTQGPSGVAAARAAALAARAGGAERGNANLNNDHQHHLGAVGAAGGLEVVGTRNGKPSPEAAAKAGGYRGDRQEGRGGLVTDHRQPSGVLHGQGQGGGGGGHGRGSDYNRCDTLLDKLISSSGAFSSIMSQRIATTRMLRKLWEKGELADAIDHLCTLHEGVIQSQDAQGLVLLADFFNAVELRGNGLCLDSCVRILPLLDGLISSNEGWASAHVVHSVLRSVISLCQAFGELIRDTRASMVAGASGVDLSREERLGKCNLCHSILYRLWGRLDAMRNQHRRYGPVIELIEHFHAIMQEVNRSG